MRTLAALRQPLRQFRRRGKAIVCVERAVDEQRRRPHSSEIHRTGGKLSVGRAHLQIQAAIAVDHACEQRPSIGVARA